jgi:hypothetical protein
MTTYRAVARHVRYWRGAVHKWSTVWLMTGTLTAGGGPGLIEQVHGLEQDINYPAPSGHGGGVWEIALYDQASGGSPIAVTSYFDPAVPSSWIAYIGTPWADLTANLMTAAEVALQVTWNAGLSRTGKPVKFRKWFHSVPEVGRPPGDPELAGSQVTSLQTTMNAWVAGFSTFGVLHGNGGRLAASVSVVDNFYTNHQMPRGRRRKVTRVAAGFAGLPAGLFVVPGSDGSLES